MRAVLSQSFPSPLARAITTKLSFALIFDKYVYQLYDGINCSNKIVSYKRSCSRRNYQGNISSKKVNKMFQNTLRTTRLFEKLRKYIINAGSVKTNEMKAYATLPFKFVSLHRIVASSVFHRNRDGKSNRIPEASWYHWTRQERCWKVRPICLPIVFHLISYENNRVVSIVKSSNGSWIPLGHCELWWFPVRSNS